MNFYFEYERSFGMPIEKFTFGEGKAEQTLAKILNERDNYSLTSLASRILEKSSVLAKSLKETDTKTQKNFYHILREHLEKHIEKHVQDTEVKSYLKNVVTKRLRSILLRK